MYNNGVCVVDLVKAAWPLKLFFAHFWSLTSFTQRQKCYKLSKVKVKEQSRQQTTSASHKHSSAEGNKVAVHSTDLFLSQAML